MNLFAFFKKHLSTDIAIDLGTANTLIYIPNQGVVLNEPTIVAVKKNGMYRDEVVEVGLSAKRMLGRTPENIQTIRPLKDGVIADFEVTQKMLTHFIEKVKVKKLLTHLTVVVCVPCRATLLEKETIIDAVVEAGASSVYLIEEPMAAALGAGLPVHEASGSMIVDIGGGTTEIAVIALSGCVYSKSIRVGGDLFDETILNYVRRKHGCIIGEATAEYIKHEVGAAVCKPNLIKQKAKNKKQTNNAKNNAQKSKSSNKSILTMTADGKLKDKEQANNDKTREVEVHGRSIAEGVPTSITLTSNEIEKALSVPLAEIIRGVKDALENTPPELSADIAERGIVMTGGGALLKNIDKLLSQETGLPVTIAEDPLTCVSRGGGKSLEYVDDRRLNMIFI